MNRLSSIAALLVLGFVSRVLADDKPADVKLPGEADVRKAIERSLPFVEKDGVAWIDRRECMSCHVFAFTMWAHVEAKAHGICIDDKKLADWTVWSRKKSISQRVFFKLDGKAIEAFPEPIRPKLTKLVGEGFTHEPEFVAALAKTLSPEELKEQQATLVTQATMKRGGANDGGGLETLVQILLGRDRAGPDSAFNAELPDFIVGMQEPSGIWKAGGQLPARRWSRATADQTTTLWTLVALAGYGDPSPSVRKSIEKGQVAVQKPAWDGNLEWLIARTLYEQKFGPPTGAPEAKGQLLARQNADGGWSVSPDGKSDAFSTGESLYALRVAGLAADDDVLRRGQKFLLDTQNADGSWTVSPALTSNGDAARHKRLEPIWRNWGTSWATIGLAKSLPTR
jgi:Squalene-hopene cyclase N-terminal domain